jgi:protein gp37
MGANSLISWTDHTFNGLRGCAKISAGCDHCYAESMSHRNPALLGVWGEEGTRVLASEKMWSEPLRWNRDAEKAGVRARVFSYSLGDVFEVPTKHENLAICNAARARIFALIPATPWLDWLLLTKRTDQIMNLVPESWRAGFPANVWIGTSVEDQTAADLRIPHLVRVPARVRFLSMEPLLGAVDLTGEDEGDMRPSFLPRRRSNGYCSRCALPWASHDARSPRSPRGHTCPPGFEGENISWVIVGGESGGGARSMHLEWARSLRAQCDAARTPFFFKQAGAKPVDYAGLVRLRDKKGGDLAELPADLRVQEFPQTRPA